MRKQVPTSVVWTDYPCEIRNKFGVWQKDVPRTDLTDEQIAELGPGFVVTREADVPAVKEN